MLEPIVSPPSLPDAPLPAPFSATGAYFAIHEWRDSGPKSLHVHHADDEAGAGNPGLDSRDF